MESYDSLVKALRIRSGNLCPGDICDRCEAINFLCSDKVMHDAAAAIEALEAEVKQAAKRNAELHAEVEKWVSAAEKAGEPKRGDMVKVVRCKDCKWSISCGYISTRSYAEWKDWFCSDGEKMEVQE